MTDLTEMSRDVVESKIGEIRSELGRELFELIEKYDNDERYEQMLVFTATMSVLAQMAATLVAYNIQKDSQLEMVDLFLEETKRMVTVFQDVDEDEE